MTVTRVTLRAVDSPGPGDYAPIALPRQAGSPSERLEPLGLRVPALLARDLLRHQLAAGEQLLARTPIDARDLQDVTRQYQAWSGSNRDLLRAIFLSEVPGLEYAAFHGPAPVDQRDVATLARRLAADVRIKVERLSDLAGRVARLAERETSPTVLLVHDAPGPLLDAVRDFLGRLGVEALAVTAEAAVTEPGKPAHALVLLQPPLTPAGALRLGYLVGTLGREAVTVLRPATVAAPALDRVPDIVLDAVGVWKLHLARALRQSGIPVDLTGTATPA